MLCKMRSHIISSSSWSVFGSGFDLPASFAETSAKHTANKQVRDNNFMIHYR
jgi:hypothetical protein